MLYTAVPPKSIEVNGIEVVEREQAVIQCITKNCRPPLMSDLSIGIEKPNTTTKVEKAPDNLYTITTSTTQIFTRTQNQDKVLCCSNIGETRCETKNINVLFPPKNVTVEEIFKHNEENGDTMMTLKFIVTESNPRSSIDLSGLKHVKRMLVDKRNDPESETYGWIFTEIWRFNFTKDDNMREIKCAVKNSGFPDLELSFIRTLNITYFPIVTISENEHKTVYLGEDVDLTCDVDSNPLSTISWHNHTGVIDEIFGAKRIELHLTDVSINHSQTYSCKAHNGIGGIVSRNITLTIIKDPCERPVSEAIKPSTESNVAHVVGLLISCLLCAILIAVIVVLIIRNKQQIEPSNKRKIHEPKIEEIKPLHPTGKDTNMQAGYEYLDMQNRSKESKLYTTLDTEMQAGNESLAGQGTTSEIEMYTNLDTEMQAGYESLAGQGTTTEIEMYTNLEGQMSTELPSEYENSEL
ncbi:cell adhesion molecule 3-like isoform X2 [Ruditapes philippinarum]|uniref:cell adhesion molecule 3-like isoform X2 n=1 Tax=Ruditapes philippinarum TaxID=129788 RepID=UPI00295A887D|nr:cell adhesion molecule 3-like isoform X2 [Ruditapes philippinarum]